MPAGFEPTIPA